MPNSSTPELKRTLSAGSLALSVINMTIGAGIFILPAIVASILGAQSFVAYILCAGLMILVMLCFADIGSKVTRSGGSYAYVEAAFGPYAGFLINTLTWFGYAVVSDAAIANAMADMIGSIYPVMLSRPVRILFFIILFGFFAIVNIRGSRGGKRLMIINTLIKLLPLVILGVYGMFKIKTSNLAMNEWPPLESFGESAFLLFFAFGGAESALGNSGEIKNPSKSVPRGIFLGLAGVLICYLIIQFVAQGVLGDELTQYKEEPLAMVAKSLMGNFGYYLLTITAILSIYGTLSGDVLATSRLIYAGGKDKIYPPIFGRIHSKYQTPAYAIGLFVILIVLLASLGGFRQLALVSSSSVLIIYLSVILATLKLKRSKSEPSGFNLPGGVTIPILAAGVVLWFLWHITWNELRAMIGFFVLVSLIYFFYSKKNLKH